MAVTFLTNEDKTILDGQINQIDNKLPVVSDAKQTNYVLENTDIDATLSIEGKAADAAAVGRELNALSEEIMDLNHETFESEIPALEWTDGKSISQYGGFQDTDGFSITHAIKTIGDSVSVNFNYTNQYISSVCFFADEGRKYPVTNGIFTSVTSGEKINVPVGALYMSVCRATANKDDVVVTFITSKLDLLESEIDEIKEVTDTIEEVIDAEITIVNGKYITPAGYDGVNEAFARSEVIPLNDAYAIEPNFTFSNNYCSVIAFFANERINYDSKSVVKTYQSVVQGEKIDVPNNAKYVVVTRLANKEIGVRLYKSDVKTNIKRIDSITSGKKKYVFFGDSIMQGVGVLNNGKPCFDAVSVVNELTDIECLNFGIGGTTLTRRNNADFCTIVDAITGVGTWESVDAYINGINSTNPSWAYMIDIIAALKALDFNTVDGVFIAYGTNDWAMSMALGDESSASETEVYGAIKYCLNKLITAYPSLKVYAASPAFRTDEIGQKHLDKSLAEYSDGIEKAWSLHGIPCKNLHKTGIINEYNSSAYLSTDGVHRNAKGYRLLGEQYAKFIMSN